METLKFDLSLLEGAKKYYVEFKDYDIIDSEFVKKFRKQHGLTQIRLAKILNVSKKTIEKWEQGKNKITGSTVVLFHLFISKPDILEELYQTNLVEFEMVESNNCNYSESLEYLNFVNYSENYTIKEQNRFIETNKNYDLLY